MKMNFVRSYDKEGIMTPERDPKSFGTFEKRAPEPLPEAGKEYQKRIVRR